MLSTILSYLFDVLYNILIRQELKIWFSCREAGVTPKLLKRAAREGGRGGDGGRLILTGLETILENFYFLWYASNVAI